MTREEKIMTARRLKENAVRMGNLEAAAKFRQQERDAISGTNERKIAAVLNKKPPTGCPICLPNGWEFVG